MCFDYRVLFYHSELTPEKLKEYYEEKISHAEKCIDSEIIKAHLTAEYEKALAALKEDTWKEIEWEDDGYTEWDYVQYDYIRYLLSFLSHYPELQGSYDSRSPSAPFRS
mgnify:CR=1 FL=1